MKIPDRLRESIKEPAYLLVTSKQEARLWRVERGEVKEIGSFEVKRPENTDREGQFRTRSRGMVMRTGSLTERKDDALLRDFMTQFEELAKVLDDSTDQLFLFTPPAVKGRVLAHMTSGPRSSLKLHVFDGNYMHNSPLDLLEKVAEHLLPQAKGAEGLVSGVHTLGLSYFSHPKR